MNSEQENILRDSIRQAIQLVKKKKLRNETKLRSVIREFIDIELPTLTEGAVPDNDPAPHRSTGINVLEDLLKKIVPILEDDFKLLTTDAAQRGSFRAHIINAVVGSLTPVEVNNDAGGLSEEVDIDVGGGESEKFIDIRTDAEKASEDEDEKDPVNTFGIEGEDETGRNLAYASYKKIESSVIDAYDLLSNSEDQEIFYEYLIANLKLYFDKFEDELATNVSEPTNQAYQAAKNNSSDEEVIDFEI
jgi:hypothetical protein